MIDLVDETNSVILMIDIQEKLLNAVYNKDVLEKNAVILTKAANVLDIPLIVTEQYPKGLGKTVLNITENNDKISFFEKTDFSAVKNTELEKYLIDSNAKKGKNQLKSKPKPITESSDKIEDLKESELPEIIKEPTDKIEQVSAKREYINKKAPKKTQLKQRSSTERTKEAIETQTHRNVIGGFIVPSSDDYVKHKLKDDFISLIHRINMSNILTSKSDWLETLDWGIAAGFIIIEYLDKIFIKLRQKPCRRVLFLVT